jgi:LEA14-like dessication related protein
MTRFLQLETTGGMSRRMRKNRGVRLGMMVAGSLLALLVGCAGLGKHLEPPRINLANIQVAEVSGLETVFEIQLRVFNTNDSALKIRGVDCDLEVNDQAFATGVSDADITVPSYGSALVPITVYSSVIHMFRGIYGLQNREQLSYRIKGRIRLENGGIVAGVLPFESEGRLSLSELTRRAR